MRNILEYPIKFQEISHALATIICKLDVKDYGIGSIEPMALYKLNAEIQNAQLWSTTMMATISAVLHGNGVNDPDLEAKIQKEIEILFEDWLGQDVNK